MFFFEQYTAAGVSTVIQVLCMILKMNISATFVVAYIQANPLYFSLTVFLFLNLIFPILLFLIVMGGGPLC